MKYDFDISEREVYQFEELLKTMGLEIKSNSDLERISLTVLEANAIHRQEIKQDINRDVRSIFSDIAGIVDFVKKILKHRNHPDFTQLIPHLQLLNKASIATLTTKSKISDDGNNKLLELYIALLCMSFGTDIRLDNPNNSKGDNPYNQKT